MSEIASSSFSPNSLAGRVAVVTGAGGGLGGAMVRILASMGARVVLLDLNVVDRLKALPRFCRLGATFVTRRRSLQLEKKLSARGVAAKCW